MACDKEVLRVLSECFRRIENVRYGCYNTGIAGENESMDLISCILIFV